MVFLLNNCTFKVYDSELINSCEPFDCGNTDLNDFFRNDSLNYHSELLGKSYCFTLDENPQVIVCAFTISNDSIKTFLLPNARKKKVIKDIPREKTMKSYPAVLIGRLGVNTNYRFIEGETERTGKQLMDFIKLHRLPFSIPSCPTNTQCLPRCRTGDALCEILISGKGYVSLHGSWVYTELLCQLSSRMFSPDLFLSGHFQTP